MYFLNVSFNREAEICIDQDMRINAANVQYKFPQNYIKNLTDLSNTEVTNF